MKNKGWVIGVLIFVIVISSFSVYLYIKSNQEDSNKATPFSEPGISGITETIGMPVIQGCDGPYGNPYWLGEWDQNASAWLSVEQYDCDAGQIVFEVPEWDKWYLVGLWNDQDKRYVFGKWIGHFLTDP